MGNAMGCVYGSNVLQIFEVDMGTDNPKVRQKYRDAGENAVGVGFASERNR